MMMTPTMCAACHGTSTPKNRLARSEAKVANCAEMPTNMATYASRATPAAA